MLDGLGTFSGITGRTWASDEPIFVPDVSLSPDYLEAIPGVRSEACVPIRCEGRPVGALNVESLGTLEPSTLDLLERCARALSERLSVVGWGGQVTPWQGAAQASVTISELTLEHDAATQALAALCAAGGLDSGALIEAGAGKLAVRSATGPLAEVLAQLPGEELGRLSALVEDMSSCYTASEATGRGFVGTESLRAFARAVVVLPLRSGGERLGTVVLANSSPRALTGEDIEPLELLAAHYAATLDASSLVARLRRQAREDHLTELGNRSAFDAELDAAIAAPHTSPLVAILDIDNFKAINDEQGHLIGDEVLRVLAARLTHDFPAVSLFRYGGDEFVLFISKIEPAEARELAESLCHAASEVLARYGSSLTAGFAQSESGESPRALLARADRALLWAKRNARGLPVFAPPVDEAA